MTVSSTTNKVTYSGNGVTDTFAYTFRILDDDDILVKKKVIATGVITTLTKTTDYTVTGVGDASGGNIVLVDPATDAPSGSQIILIRNVSATQETDYTEYDTFPSADHEGALDKLTMLVQQQTEKIDRSLKLDPGISGVSAEIEGTPSAGDTIRLNADEDGWEYTSLSDIGSYNFDSGIGFLIQTAPDTATVRTHTGTANEITVTNGNGASGNPVYSLPSALTFTSKTITGGTFVSPTFSGTVAGDHSYSGAITFSSTVTIGSVAIAPTSFGASLLDDTNAAAGRTTLGLGTLATQDGTFSGTFSGTHSGTSSGTNTGDQTNIAGNAATATSATTSAALTNGGALNTPATGSVINCTGAVAQLVYTESGDVQTGTTLIPADNTKPQRTEGFEVMTVSITPKKTTNKLKITVTVNVAFSAANGYVAAALFQDNVDDALGVGWQYVTAAHEGRNITFEHFMDAGTTSSTTFKVRLGCNAAGTVTFNGAASARIYGDAMASSISVEEFVV